MKSKRIYHIRNTVAKSEVIFSKNVANFHFNAGRNENVSEFKFDKILEDQLLEKIYM